MYEEKRKPVLARLFNIFSRAVHMYEQKTNMYEQNRPIVLFEQYIEKPSPKCIWSTQAEQANWMVEYAIRLKVYSEV